MDIKKFSVRFKVRHDEQDTGFVGAVPVSVLNNDWQTYLPNWQPSHDILEHSTRGEFGALYQELQALGAVLHCRGWVMEDGFYAGQCRSKALGYDLINSYRDALYATDLKRRDLLEFPKFPKFSLSKEDKEKFENFFRLLKTYVAEYWESEFDYTDENFFLENWEQTKTAIMYGYYKAVKRWGDMEVRGLAKQIDKVMLEAEKQMSEFVDTELTFTLKCEVGYHYAHAEVVYPYSWMG